MMDTPRLFEAVSFAARAHLGQLRKDGRTPYFAHPVRVCLVVRTVFGIEDEDMLAAALLHDTIEDTTTDYDDVVGQFGPEVAGMVQALTKDKRLPDAEREKFYAQSLVAGGWRVHVLKLADIYDNLSDIETMPPEKRRRTIDRTKFYLDMLAAAVAPEAKAAYVIVRNVWDEKAALVK